MTTHANFGDFASSHDLSDSEPDPARSYERAKPYKEYGDDRLEACPCPPCHAPDQMIRAVHNAHQGHQVNDESEVNAGDSCPLD